MTEKQQKIEYLHFNLFAKVTKTVKKQKKILSSQVSIYQLFK
jgi:hypothetical protein